MPRTSRQKQESLRTGLLVQAIATIGAFGMIVLNQYTEPDINDLFIWAMFGLAYGARPETVTGIVKGGK